MNQNVFQTILIYIIFLAFMCEKTEGDATEEDFLSLYDTLITDYKRHMRPIANQSAAVNVTLQFQLLAIEEIDDIKQHVDVLAVVTILWHDKNLVWNPEDYGGINRLFPNNEKIWTPNVYSLTSPTNDASLSSLPTQLAANSDGSVISNAAGIVRTTCPLDMTYFPFDSHRCEFGFGVLDYSLNEVFLQASDDDVKISTFFIEHEEWDVGSAGTKADYLGIPSLQFNNVVIHMVFKRRPIYYILNVLLPTVDLGILSLLTFIVPPESGERLSYTLTTLLALSFYIPYIGGLIPTSSLNIPVVLRYLISLCLINVMCVVMSAVIIAIRWSDVVKVNDVKKTVLIFGIPFTFRKRRGDKGFALWQNTSRVGVDTSEAKHHLTLKGSGVQDIHSDKKDRKINEHASQPVVNGEHLHGTEEQMRGRNYRRTQSKEEEYLEGLDLAGAVKESKVDPDIMVISDRVSRYSFLVLALSFFIMTFLTFAQLYYQSF